jgi:multiple sugar transport system permease protein
MRNPRRRLGSRSQASWVDQLRPLVYLREPGLYTLPLGLKSVLDQFGQGGEREWEIVLAARVVPPSRC